MLLITEQNLTSITVFIKHIQFAVVYQQPPVCNKNNNKEIIFKRAYDEELLSLLILFDFEEMLSRWLI